LNEAHRSTAEPRTVGAESWLWVLARKGLSP